MAATKAKLRESPIGDTTEIESERVTGGALDEKGIIMLFSAFPEKADNPKFGTYYSVPVQVDDGGELVDTTFQFGSKKLYKLITKYWNMIEGKRVRVSATGVDFEREYHLALVED